MAARISGHALDGITSIPNTFGCHPAQVQVLHLVFQVLALTHTQSALSPAEALRSLARGYKAPEAAGAHAGSPWGCTQNLWVVGVQLG